MVLSLSNTLTPLEAACARGDVSEVRRRLQAGERPTTTFASHREYRHLTIADLASGAFHDDEVLYMRSNMECESDGSQMLVAEGQIKRLLAAADEQFLEFHSHLGTTWVERAAQVLSEDVVVTDWPAPASLPAEIAWGERQMSLEKKYDAEAFSETVSAAFAPAAALADLSLNEEEESAAAAPAHEVAEETTSPASLLTADLLAMVLRLACLSNDAKQLGSSSSIGWLRMLDCAAVCREWRASAVTCARRRHGHGSSECDGADAPISVQAEDLVPPYRLTYTPTERPSFRMVVTTRTADFACGSAFGAASMQLPPTSVGWHSRFTEKQLSEAFHTHVCTRARLDRAHRERALTFATSTCLDAQRCRRNLFTNNEALDVPPPLMLARVSEVMRDVRCAMRVEARYVNGVEGSAVELEATAQAVEVAVARWLLQNHLRVVSVRVPLRQSGPKWWDDEFEWGKDIFALAEQHLLLIGAEARAGRSGHSLVALHATMQNDASSFLEGRTGPC